MKKLLLLSFIFAVGCSKPDAVTTTPTVAVVPVIVHECTCNAVFEQRQIAYNGLAQVTFDSGWIAVQDMGFYSYVCSDNGTFVDKGDVYLSNSVRVFKRYRIYKL